LGQPKSEAKAFLVGHTTPSGSSELIPGDGGLIDFQTTTENMAEFAVHQSLGPRNALIIAAACFATAAPVLHGQAAPSQDILTSPAEHSPESFVYEVAAIHPSAPGLSGSHISSDNGSFQAGNVTLKALVQQAYDLPPMRILAGPSWFATAHFDIAAKPDDAVTESLRHLKGREEALAEQHMLQALLADRFQLKTHSESRAQPIYAMVVAKRGPKLRPTQAQGTSVNGRYGQLTVKGGDNTMAVLADALSRNLGRVVVDKTGIEGRYELTLTWSPDELAGARPGASAKGGDNTIKSAPPPDPSAPSIFTAVQEQLGLKLLSRKGPVEMLVIDHAEMPSEN
jgi:uncharacterized protein (TIGR03435 family)